MASYGSNLGHGQGERLSISGKEIRYCHCSNTNSEQNPGPSAVISA
ncbi:hypothetical protein JOC69_000120 [Heliobacterium gestii]|nr:hypothetical protein [Heliomicrobium gestii]